MKTLLTLAAAAMSLTLFAQTTDDPHYTADGQLMRPDNYREWIFLSSGLGMTYNAAATSTPANPNFDNVFVKPSAYKAFMETGTWPDKTMFVLEVRASTSNGSINKGGHYQDRVAAMEVESLHYARETLTLGGAGHLDPHSRGEDVALYSVAQRVF